MEALFAGQQVGSGDGVIFSALTFCGRAITVVKAAAQKVCWADRKCASRCMTRPTFLATRLGFQGEPCIALFGNDKEGEATAMEKQLRCSGRIGCFIQEKMIINMLHFMKIHLGA